MSTMTNIDFINSSSPLILANKYTIAFLPQFLSSGNFCSIKFTPFWLPQLSVTFDNKLTATIRKVRVIFVILANEYEITQLLQLLLNSVSINLKNSDYQ